MKKSILLLMLVISGFSVGQKKDILVGAFSEMEINYDLKNQEYYNSDIGKSIDDLKLIWSGYKIEKIKNGIVFSNDYVDIQYLFDNKNVVYKKILIFESFSNFNFALNAFYQKNHPIYASDGTFSKYHFNEEKKAVLFSTSFFAYGVLNKVYDNDNDYYFYINFEKE